MCALSLVVFAGMFISLTVRPFLGHGCPFEINLSLSRPTTVGGTSGEGRLEFETRGQSKIRTKLRNIFFAGCSISL